MSERARVPAAPGGEGTRGPGSRRQARPALLLAACVLAFVSAASLAPAQQPSRDPTRAERPAASGAEAARVKAAGRAAPAGKPVAAFAVEHRVTGTPMIGLPLELHLTLRPESSIEDVVVQLSADPGLFIDAASTRLEAASAGRDAPAEWVVEVVPVEDGLSHVKITAEGLIDGARQARSLMVPIRVGDAKGGEAPPKAQTPGAEAGDAPDADREPDGEALIRLPAEESH